MKSAIFAPMPSASTTNGGKGEGWCAHQPAHALANVTGERLEPLPAPCLARMLADDSRVAEETQRRLPRLSLVHAGGAVLCDLLFKMEAQFVLELNIRGVAAE